MTDPDDDYMPAKHRRRAPARHGGLCRLGMMMGDDMVYFCDYAPRAETAIVRKDVTKARVFRDERHARAVVAGLGLQIDDWLVQPV